MSSRRAAEIGDRVVDPDGVIWQVMGIRSADFGRVLTDLRSSDGFHRAVIDAQELASKWKLVTPAPMLPDVPFAAIDSIPEGERERVIWRLNHLLEMLNGTRGGEPSAPPLAQYDPEQTTLGQRVESKHKELAGAGEDVSRRTLYNWKSRWEKEGLWGLVDGRKVRRSTALADEDPRVVAAIEGVLSDHRDKSTPTVSAIVGHVVEELAKLGIQPPSERTIRRRIEEMTSSRYAFSEAPTRRTNVLPKQAFTPQVATRPGEWVQADTTRLDVLGILPDGSTGAVELSITLDVATRSILSSMFTPASTKAVDISLLLADAMSPAPMREGWEDWVRASHHTSPLVDLVELDDRLAESAARPIVYPETFAIDRGKAFLSASTINVCEYLGISVQPARAFRGSDKAIVERTFQSINTLFCQFLPGYKGRTTSHRGKNVDEETCYTLEELQDLFDWWVVAYWQRRPHEGLRNPLAPSQLLTPNQMYAAAVSTCGYVPMPLETDIYVRLLPRTDRLVGPQGISFQNRTYDSEKLRPYRNVKSTSRTSGGKWSVHFNPNDLRQIWLYDESAGKMVEVPWIFASRIHQPFTAQLWRTARRIAEQERSLAPTEATAMVVLNRLMSEVSKADAKARILILRALAREGAPTVTERAFQSQTALAQEAVEVDDGFDSDMDSFDEKDAFDVYRDEDLGDLYA